MFTRPWESRVQRVGTRGDLHDCKRVGRVRPFVSGMDVPIGLLKGTKRNPYRPESVVDVIGDINDEIKREGERNTKRK